MRPIRLGPNQPAARFYRGGAQIAAFRRQSEPAQEFTPEDWVGSVTTVFGETDLGLSRLGPDRLLVETISADPTAWLGADHVQRWGANPALLVKLLDAGERLPVHLHPHRGFAERHLGLVHGKAEAWVLLAPAEIHLGWRRDVDSGELATWVEQQDITAMLAAMHPVEVQPGDAVYVPPGCPHAIGAGAFLVEVQEPTDLSILLEWRGFALDGPRDGHLGLGFETALGAVDLHATTDVGLDQLMVRADDGEPRGSRLPSAAAEYFRVEQHALADGELDAGYSVLVVLAGAGPLISASSGWEAVDLTAGDTVLVPYAAGDLVTTGSGQLLRCRPPVRPGDAD